MLRWFNIALPILTLILGSGLTLVGQALTDRRATRRETIARREGLRVRQVEWERETMMELQNRLTEIDRTLRRGPKERARGLLEDLMVDAFMLTLRLWDSEIYDLLQRYASMASNADWDKVDPASLGATSPQYQELQRALGAALRRDPMEHPLLKLAKPPLHSDISDEELRHITDTELSETLDARQQVRLRDVRRRMRQRMPPSPEDWQLVRRTRDEK
jgi:hypothetical protein